MPDPRPFIGILFKCCNVYSRIYLNREGTAYEGVFPKCYAKRVVVKIVNDGGSTDRFFEAD